MLQDSDRASYLQMNNLKSCPKTTIQRCHCTAQVATFEFFSALVDQVQRNTPNGVFQPFLACFFSSKWNPLRCSPKFKKSLLQLASLIPGTGTSRGAHPPPGYTASCCHPFGGSPAHLPPLWQTPTPLSCPPPSFPILLLFYSPCNLQVHLQGSLSISPQHAT